VVVFCNKNTPWKIAKRSGAVRNLKSFECLLCHYFYGSGVLFCRFPNLLAVNHYSSKAFYFHGNPEQKKNCPDQTKIQLKQKSMANRYVDGGSWKMSFLHG